MDSNAGVTGRPPHLCLGQNASSGALVTSSFLILVRHLLLLAWHLLLVASCSLLTSSILATSVPAPMLGPGMCRALALSHGSTEVDPPRSHGKGGTYALCIPKTDTLRTSMEVDGTTCL